MKKDEHTSRYLSASAVADYISVSRSMVDTLVRHGVLPPAHELTPRMKRWDRLEIDAAICGKATALALSSSHASVADLAKEIADGIIAKGRLSAAEKARRRVG